MADAAPSLGSEPVELSTWHVPPEAVAALHGASRKAYNQAVESLAEGIVALGGELKCPVCLSLMKSPTQCPCGHVFCQDCIKAALRVDKRCPMCKHPCNKRELAVSYVYQGIIDTYRAIQPQGLDVDVEFTQPTTFSQICGAMIAEGADTSMDSAATGAGTAATLQHRSNGATHPPQDAGAGEAPDAADSDEDDFFNITVDPAVPPLRPVPPTAAAAALPPASQPEASQSSHAPPTPTPPPATPPRRTSSRRRPAATAAPPAPAISPTQAAAADMRSLLAKTVILALAIPRRTERQLQQLQEALGHDLVEVVTTWNPSVTHCIVPTKVVGDPRVRRGDAHTGKRRRVAPGSPSSTLHVARHRSDGYLQALLAGAHIVNPEWLAASVRDRPFALVAEQPYHVAGDDESLRSAITQSALLNAGPAAARAGACSSLLAGLAVVMVGLWQFPAPIEKHAVAMLAAMGAGVLPPGSTQAEVEAFLRQAAEQGCSPVLLLDDSKAPAALPGFLAHAVERGSWSACPAPISSVSVQWMLDSICTATHMDLALPEYAPAYRVTLAASSQHT